jgi:O-antigen/teichoic acid export membrane protein
VNQKYSLFWIFKGNFKNIKTDFRDEMKVNTVSSLLGYLDNNGAAYVVIKLLGVKALGVFDTLTKASRIFKTAFGFFSTSIMPHAIGREAKKGPQAPIAIFGKVVFLSSFVVFPLIFNLIPLNEVILNFVFGSEVAVYSSAFSLTLLAMISMIYAGLLGATFNARLSTVMITTKVMFFENLIGLPLLYVMATQYGIWGVCANRALVVTLGYFFRLQQTAREYQFSVNVFVKNMLNSLLIGTFFGASLFGLRQSGLEMPAPLFVAPLFMFLCWILIFYKSDQAHKELLSRFYSESVVLIRRLTGRKV